MVTKRKLSMDNQMSRRQSKRNKIQTNENLDDNQLNILNSEMENPSANSIEDEFSDDEVTTEFEKRRDQNLKENAEFLSQLGIQQAKQELIDSTKKPHAVKGLKIPGRKSEPVPLRPKSLRLQNRPVETTSAYLDNTSYAAMWPERSAPERLSAGPLPMDQQIINIEDELIVNDFHESLARLSLSPSPKDKKTTIEKHLQTLKKLKCSEENLAKITQNRIFCVGFHPTMDKILAFAGDKRGNIGLWDVESKLGQDGVFTYKPHASPTSCIAVDPFNHLRLLSCSYDGTIRCATFENKIFDEIYATPIDDEIRLTCFDWLSRDTLVATHSDGQIAVVDIRTDNKNAENSYHISDKVLKCVQVHPFDKDYIVTTGTDCVVAIWDIRNMKKTKSQPINSFRHQRVVDSAYFSPLKGKRLISTSIDNTIKVFETSSDLSSMTLKQSIRHNNHTGRWLSNFKANWYPFSDDIFVIGSMDRPRKIEVYRVDTGIKEFEYKDEHLGSVSSINAFHPNRDMLIGGNSSGKVFIFS